MTYDGVVVV